MKKGIVEKFGITDRKAAYVLTLLLSALVVLTWVQDFLRSNINISPFYFTESFMFSLYWLLFTPLLFAQYIVVKHANKKGLLFQLAVIILPFFFHLFAFPILVWVLSTAFYYQSFSFEQTFNYTLSEHIFSLLLFYTIPFLLFSFFTKNFTCRKSFSEVQNGSLLLQPITSIVVSEGNKKQSIAVSEILYFSANTPYINIYIEDKKYLLNETLKSISAKLNPQQFVRIHKSTIVNIEMVASYTSRLNGDYDLAMKNNVQLRVSRNFAVDFKNRFNKTHPFTTK